MGTAVRAATSIRATYHASSTVSFNSGLRPPLRKTEFVTLLFKPLQSDGRDMRLNLIGHFAVG
jgi:hypothetical protein